MSRRRDRQTQTEAEWNFRSFPTYFAFALGAFISTILVPYVSLPILVISLFGVSIGIAHMMTRYFRHRGLDRARQREEEDERERRALAARAAASQHNEAASVRRRRQRRRRNPNDASS
jgi:hypothetical protein